MSNINNDIASEFESMSITQPCKNVASGYCAPPNWDVYVRNNISPYCISKKYTNQGVLIHSIERFGIRIQIRNGTPEDVNKVRSLVFKFYKSGATNYIDELVYDKKARLGFIIVNKIFEVTDEIIPLFIFPLASQKLHFKYRTEAPSEEEWKTLRSDRRIVWYIKLFINWILHKIRKQ